MAGNKLSDNAIAKVRQWGRTVDGLQQSLEQGQRVRGGEPGPDWFHARITGWAVIIANARWKYAWTEVLYKNDAGGIPQDIVRAGGRSGTTTAGFAINDWETNNIAAHTGAQADGIPQTPPYPPNFNLLPIGGGAGGVVANQAVVRISIISDAAGLARAVFTMQNAHFGSCPT